MNTHAAAHVRFTAGIVAAVVTLIGLCHQATAQTTPVPKTDEQILRDLIQQVNDGKKVIKYTKDLIFVSGAYPQPFVGLQRFEAGRIKAEDAAKLRPHQKKKEEMVRLVVSRSGDLAYEYGNMTINWDGENNKRTGFEGSYLRVWRKEDDQWKVEVVFARRNEEEKTSTR